MFFSRKVRPSVDVDVGPLFVRHDRTQSDAAERVRHAKVGYEVPQRDC